MRKNFLPNRIISVVFALILAFSVCVVAFADNALTVKSCAIDSTDDGIQTDAAIVIVFSDNVNDSSVRRTNISKIYVLDSSGKAYSVNINTGYDENGKIDNNSFVITPATSYKTGESYKVVIQKGVTGKTGATLTETRAYTFTMSGEKKETSSLRVKTTTTTKKVTTTTTTTTTTTKVTTTAATTTKKEETTTAPTTVAPADVVTESTSDESTESTSEETTETIPLPTIRYEDYYDISKTKAELTTAEEYVSSIESRSTTPLIIVAVVILLSLVILVLFRKKK